MHPTESKSCLVYTYFIFLLIRLLTVVFTYDRSVFYNDSVIHTHPTEIVFTYDTCVPVTTCHQENMEKT